MGPTIGLAALVRRASVIAKAGDVDENASAGDASSSHLDGAV